jgi:long-chain fatty acid transport protein
MQNRFVAALFGSALLCATPRILWANGMRLVSQDGFATARGEAFVATADNPSAIYYNPAGLTQITGHELRSGIYGLYFDPTFQPPATAANAGETFHLERNYAAAPQTFYAFGSDELPLAGGLGIYAPYGADVTWPQDTGFRAVAISGKLTYIRFNPALALKFFNQLSVGVGVLVDYGDLEMEQGLLRTEAPFRNYFQFSGDGWDVGGNLGLLWRPWDKLSIGATLRSTTQIEFEGKTEFEQQPIIQSTRLPAKAEFKFPWTAVVGISYRPTPKWNFEFNADYTEWSSLGTVTIRQSEPAPFPVRQNIPVTLEWDGSWIYSFGATRYFDDGWRLSTGYVFNETSVPDDFYSPLAADLDRHFFTIGIGRKGKRFDFDLAYQFGYGPEHIVTGSTPPSQPGLFSGQRADGTYDFISHAVMVSVGLRF